MSKLRRAYFGSTSLNRSPDHYGHLIVIVKVLGSERSEPPPAVAPLSCAMTVTVAVPLLSLAGVNVKVPPELMDGWMENRLELLLLTIKLTVWPDSFVGPGLVLVTQPAFW